MSTRLATFVWESPPPASVDEELAIDDEGGAWLVVRSPRAPGPAIGTYGARPSPADQRVLVAAGPGPVRFDVVAPADEATAALRAAADRVAADARTAPAAVATFHARATVTGNLLSVGLLVVGSGARAVQFELDPASSSVQFEQDGHPTGWVSVPHLEAGFVTPLAAGLGGVRRRARVAPGEYGAISFEVPAPRDANRVAIRVTGWLVDALPDQPMPARFDARTDVAPIERA